MKLTKSFEQLAAQAKETIREISLEELAGRLQNGRSPEVLIDVRENDEFRAGHLPGARGIGRGVLEYHIAEEVPDAATEIVLYCRGGNRSALAAASLQEMGYCNVYSLRGGFRDWTSDPDRPVSLDGAPIKH